MAEVSKKADGSIATDKQATSEEYSHRGKDKFGNPDDNYTEKEALEIARKQGIEFVDSYAIQGKEFEQRFKTRNEAEKHAEKGEIVVQIRERKFE